MRTLPHFCPRDQCAYLAIRQDFNEGVKALCNSAVALGLHPAHVREVAGLIFVCLAEAPIAFEEAGQSFAGLRSQINVAVI